MGIFDSLFPNISGAAQPGLSTGFNLGSSALNQGLGQVNQLYPEAINYLRSVFPLALAPLQDVAQTGRAGQTALNTLLGIGRGGKIGDPTTMSTALNYLRGTPGYEFAKEQGLGALDRANAARGGTFSGGAAADAAKYVTGLADQTYQSAVGNLAPYTKMFAGGAEDISRLYGGLGTGVSNLLTGQAGAQQPYYSGLANLGQWLGGSEANVAAQQSAFNAKNLWDAIGGGLRFASSGGLGQLGGALGQLGGAFGSSFG